MSCREISVGSLSSTVRGPSLKDLSYLLVLTPPCSQEYQTTYSRSEPFLSFSTVTMVEMAPAPKRNRQVSAGLLHQRLPCSGEAGMGKNLMKVASHLLLNGSSQKKSNSSLPRKRHQFRETQRRNTLIPASAQLLTFIPFGVSM